MMQPTIDYTIKVEDVTDDLIIRRCRCLSDALKLCRDCCPEKDDYIIDELCKRSSRDRCIQPSHFSEMLSGKRAFPQDLTQHLENICGNWIPTRYMALSRNQELRPKMEAWEIENRRLRAALSEKEKELEIIRNWERSK